MASKKKGEEKMGWTAETKLMRLSNTSNAFIFPTMDKTRWLQIRNMALDSFQKLYSGIEYDVYEWDMVENRILRMYIEDEKGMPAIKGEEYRITVSRTENASVVKLVKKDHVHEVSQIPTSAQIDLTWKYFVQEMRDRPIILILKATALTNLNREAMTKVIDNMVGVVSRDPAIFKQTSSLFVIVPSAEYLSETAQKLSVVIDIPIGEEWERKRRLEIIASNLKKMGLLKTDKISEDLLKATAGLNLDEIETASLMSAYQYGELKIEAYTRYKIDMLKKVGIEYIQPEYGFEAVGGYDDLKEYIQTHITDVLKHPEVALPYGDELPRGMILYGLPGTGKTWFAHALAKELNLPVVKISPADFLRGIVGETEARIKQITRIIDSISPAVVFIDEIDQLGMARDRVMSTDSGASRRMTNMLLEWLGDKNRRAFVVGATNFLGDMDPAFIRPGRIDKIVFVPTPDLQSRYEILKLHMLKIRPINTKKIKFNEDILWEVAKQTDFWTGAELEQLCKNVKSLARINRDKEITLEHFNTVLKSMKVDVSRRKEELAAMLKTMRVRGNNGSVDWDYVEKIEKKLGISAIDMGDTRISPKKGGKVIDELEVGGWGL